MKTINPKILLLFCPIVVFYGFNYQNIPLQFSLFIGIISFPYIVKAEAKKGGIRYAALAAILGVVLLFYRSSTLYYFSSIFILFFVLEKWWGRLNHLPLLLAIAVSPIISSIVYIWSFPIRLQLSQCVGQILRSIEMDIHVSGNVLTLDGHAFSVDPACIGLKMLISSIVLGIVILAYYEKKYNYTLPFWQTLFLLGSLILGAILANFIRLLMLVIFHILPENPMHDIVGILSLLIYVLLPFYFLMPFVFGKINKKKIAHLSDKKNIIYRQVSSPIKWIFTILLLLQIYNGIQFLQNKIDPNSAFENIQIDGLKKEITANGILKLQNEETLIYIKPPIRFFQGSHDPRFCWQGSGYDFSEIQIESLGGKSIYTAILTKGTDKMYTAWWYENTKIQTPYEWDWRWKSVKRKGGFYMINISCGERTVLEQWIEKNILKT